MTNPYLPASLRLNLIAVSLAASTLSAIAAPSSYECQALPDGATSPETSHAAAGGVSNKNAVVGTGTGLIFGQESTGPMQWSKDRVGTRLPNDSNTGNTLLDFAAQINSAGKSAGAIYDSHGQPRPVAWKNGALVELRSLASDGRGYAVAVNESGTVVGKSIVKTTRGDVDRATLWRANGRIVYLGAKSKKDSSVAFDVNDAGWAVGTNTSFADSRTFPVIWQDGDITELPNPPDGDFSNVSALNDMSEAVGATFYSLQGTRATAWRGTEPRDLGGYGDSGLTYAVDINDSSVVIGNSRDASHRETPLRWANLSAEAQDLNELVVGGCIDAFGIERRLTSVGAINDKGVITATASVSVNGQTNSFAFRLMPR